MDGITASVQIYRDAPIPVILVSAHNDIEYIRGAEAHYALSYLLKPIQQATLKPAIAIVMHRFEQFQTMQQETADLKQALEDRKPIERAKGLVMKNASVAEVEAARRLEKAASERNVKLVDIARMMLTAGEAFQVAQARSVKVARH